MVIAPKLPAAIGCQSPGPEIGPETGKETLKANLELELRCDRAGKTILQRRYMAYPLSVSPVFRREETSAQRAYLYRMNTSPGLLAGDEIGMRLRLGEGSALYLADQAATKVHAMPQAGTRATVCHDIDVGDRATLEFLPEPIILFADSALAQTTEITMHPTGALSLGEIVLPGRLARGEVYQFRQYWSRLQVRSPAGQVWFVETMNLLGKENLFSNSPLFASGRVLGALVLILPAGLATPENLAKLGNNLDAVATGEAAAVDLASSVLPGGRGLFVRAIAATAQPIQNCFRGAVNCVRQLRGQALLPRSL